MNRTALKSQGSATTSLFFSITTLVIARHPGIPDGPGPYLGVLGAVLGQFQLITAIDLVVISWLVRTMDTVEHVAAGRQRSGAQIVLWTPSLDG
jgi:hypothetical protein